MMRRTRKWSFVAQEAKRLAEIGLSPREIGDRLGVNKSTVTRWIASGKLKPPKKRTVSDVVVSARSAKSPSEWAASVRAEYDLDETDNQLVTIAEEALQLSLNLTVTPSVRMTAAGRFQALVRQLNLVMRRENAKEEMPPAAEAERSTKKNPPVKRRAGAADPRKALMQLVVRGK